MKKILLTALLSAGTFTTVFAAQSVSGTTDFKVTIPEVLVLYHWDQAHLKFDPGKAFDRPDTTSVREKIVTLPTTVSAPIEIPGPAVDTTWKPELFKKTIDVVLKDSWAVRAITTGSSATPTVKLDLAVQNATLKKDGTDTTSTATVSAGKLEVRGTNALGPNASLNVPANWATPVVGSINFKLDLANVKKAGVYKSAASRTAGQPNNTTDTFKLTLTGN